MIYQYGIIKFSIKNIWKEGYNLNDPSAKEKEIYVKVDISEKEYIRASLYLIKKNIFILYLGTFFILVTTFYLLSFGQSQLSSLIIAIVATLFVIILSFYRTVWLYRKKFKKDRLLKEKVTYKIDLKGIEASRERGSVFMYWSDYSSIKEYQDLFLLYISDTQAQIIPEHCFQTEEDKQQFKLLIANNK